MITENAFTMRIMRLNAQNLIAMVDCYVLVLLQYNRAYLQSNSPICIGNKYFISSDCLKIGTCMLCESVDNRCKYIVNKSCRCS